MSCDLKWIILDNILFGFNEESKNYMNSSNINKIILFDLDNTIIKTKSGKVFPINKNDWTFIIKQVPQIIYSHIKSGAICGIISNQKGLRNSLLINNWIDKINDINKQLKLHFVFVSLKDDNFRKPLPSSWDYIKNNFIANINYDKLLKDKKIYYIGDAFGRISDFSDTDYKYSVNCKFKFKTPELFFKFNLDDPNIINGSITYPIIDYYSKNKQIKLFQTIFNIIESSQKIFIMLIGFPASGKSFLRKEIIKKYPDFKYINNDDSVDNFDNPNLITSNKNINQYNKIISDNTNLNIKNRLKILTDFDSHLKIAIWFDYTQEQTSHLNYMRMFWFGSKLISPLIYRTFNKNFTKPEDVAEGFDKLFIISKVFNNFDFSNKIQYYF